MAKDKAVIETGVDKLVSLINSKKKVTVKESAKELGVGVSVIEEWADFLEEEGIINIDHKLTRSELIFKEMPKETRKTGQTQVMKDFKVWGIADVEKKIDDRFTMRCHTCNTVCNLTPTRPADFKVGKYGKGG